MKQQLIILNFVVFACGIPLASCQAAPKRQIASIESVSAEQVSTWKEKFKSAQSLLNKNDKQSCNEFRELLKIQAPTTELKLVGELREMQACKKNDFHLPRVDSEWLIKDAVIFGLRNTNNPDTFLKYYRRFQKLDANAKAELEFLERSSLFGSILKKARRDSATFKELLDLFPSFYVEYKLAVPEERKFEAAYGLRMLRNFQEARTLYEEIIKTHKAMLGKNKKTNIESLEQIEKAYEFIRVSYRVEEKKEKGIQEIRKALGYFENFISKQNLEKTVPSEYFEYYVKIGVQLARDIWTEGKREEAEKLLNDIEIFSKEKTSLSQIYWVKGRMRQDDGKYLEAIDFFKSALVENKDKDFQLKLLWLVGWNQRKVNKLDDAIKSFEELERVAAKSLDYEVQRNKALFWQAKTLADLGERGKSNKIYKKIAEEHSFGYYGRLALLEIDPDYWNQKIKPGKIKIDREDTIASNIQTLSDLDQIDIASEYIQAIWLKQKPKWRRKLENKIYLLTLNDLAGLLKENQQYIEIFDPEDKGLLFQNYSNLMFPMPYHDLTAKYSTTLNVPKEIVYSIMRQESLFDSKARSHADAFGLLQLIPRIAAQNQKKVPVGYQEPQDLFKPEVVIPLGISQLSTLQKMFDGSKMLAAGSYNAGAIPVRKWQKLKFNEDPLEFIEDIPYAETETYVKLVFRNLSFYILLNEQMSGPERMEFLRNYFKLPQISRVGSRIEGPGEESN